MNGKETRVQALWAPEHIDSNYASVTEKLLKFGYQIFKVLKVHMWKAWSLAEKKKRKIGGVDVGGRRGSGRGLGGEEEGKIAVRL